MVNAAYDFSKSGINVLADIGGWLAFDFVSPSLGGYGQLISTILKAAPSMKGIVVDLPQVVSDPSKFEAPKHGVGDRCEYRGGSFFDASTLPTADAYIMKHILHDWRDDKV